jgi:hypothetical protein
VGPLPASCGLKYSSFKQPALKVGWPTLSVYTVEPVDAGKISTCLFVGRRLRDGNSR